MRQINRNEITKKTNKQRMKILKYFFQITVGVVDLFFDDDDDQSFNDYGR